MSLYYKLKLIYALYELKHHRLKFIDIWYYDNHLQKECVLTLITQLDLDRYLSELTEGVKKQRYVISYIHLGKSVL